MCGEVRLVDLLDGRVQAQVFLVELARHGQGDIGEGRAATRHPGRAEDRIGQHLAGLRRVHDATVQVQFGVAVKRLIWRVFVEIDFQRSLRIPHRRHVRAAALVTQADARVRRAVNHKVRADVREIEFEIPGPLIGWADHGPARRRGRRPEAERPRRRVHLRERLGGQRDLNGVPLGEAEDGVGRGGDTEGRYESQKRQRETNHGKLVCRRGERHEILTNRRSRVMRT